MDNINRSFVRGNDAASRSPSPDSLQPGGPPISHSYSAGAPVTQATTAVVAQTQGNIAAVLPSPAHAPAESTAGTEDPGSLGAGNLARLPNEVLLEIYRHVPTADKASYLIASNTCTAHVLSMLKSCTPEPAQQNEILQNHPVLRARQLLDPLLAKGSCGITADLENANELLPQLSSFPHMQQQALSLLASSFHGVSGAELDSRLEELMSAWSDLSAPASETYQAIMNIVNEALARMEASNAARTLGNFLREWLECPKIDVELGARVLNIVQDTLPKLDKDGMWSVALGMSIFDRRRTPRTDANTAEAASWIYSQLDSDSLLRMLHAVRSSMEWIHAASPDAAEKLQTTIETALAVASPATIRYVIDTTIGKHWRPNDKSPADQDWFRRMGKLALDRFNPDDFDDLRDHARDHYQQLIDKYRR